MNSLIYIGAFIVAIGVLVTIHELGHYWVARWCNVKILRFSIGFGRPLLLRRLGRDKTEWVLAAIPLGGFVKMLDERDDDEGKIDPAQAHRAFNRQNPWKRIAIVLAGPAANFLLAALLYWVLFIQGVPGAKPYIAAPVAGTVAAAAGFADFDLVRKVGDQRIETWQDLRWVLLKEAVGQGTVSVEVEDAKGRLFERRLGLEGIGSEDLDKDFLAKLGLAQVRVNDSPIIGRVLEDSRASAAGLKPEDRVLEVDGEKIKNWGALVRKIQKSANVPLTLMVQRGSEVLTFDITPDNAGGWFESLGRIGIESREAKLYTVVRYGALEAVGKAGEKVWEMSIFSLKMLGKMITGDISWKNLSGPITIADYAGQSAKIGVNAYLTFLALVSISIGVLNLLPIPVLDGGQLVYYVVEILKGSPVSERVIEVGQQVGLVLLLGLTAFAFYNDIHRLLTG